MSPTIHPCLDGCSKWNGKWVKSHKHFWHTSVCHSLHFNCKCSLVSKFTLFKSWFTMVSSTMSRRSGRRRRRLLLLLAWKVFLVNFVVNNSVCFFHQGFRLWASCSNITIPPWMVGFLLLLFDDNNNNKRNTYCRLTKLPFDSVVVSLFCGVCDVVDLVDFVWVTYDVTQHDFCRIRFRKEEINWSFSSPFRNITLTSLSFSSFCSKLNCWSLYSMSLHNWMYVYIK